MWKNRIVYLILLLCSSVISILYNVYSTGLAALVLWLLPLGLLFFLLAGQAFVRVMPKKPEEIIHLGNKLETGYIVENRSFLPGFPGKAVITVRLFCGEEEGEKPSKTSLYRIKKNFVLKGRSRQEIEMPIKAKHCGKMEIQYKSMWIFDYFGLWGISRRKAGAVYKVCVLPELVELSGIYVPDSRYSFREPESYSESQKGEDFSEIFGFHEYQPGDRIQDIHWKLSSKKEALIIKEYSSPVVVTTGIWAEPGKESGEARNTIFSALFSLSMALLERGFPHYIYYGKESFLVKTEEQIIFIFDAIYSMNSEIRRLPKITVADLFYIGKRKKEEIADLLEADSFIRMVDTEHIEEILETEETDKA